MLINEMLIVALQSVRANLFRAILTMLGIIIGVASVITMVAIGSGAKAAVDEQIEALGASVLSIRPGTTMHMGVSRGSETLSVDDAEALARDGTDSIDAVIPEMSGQLQVKLGNRNQSIRVLATNSGFAPVGGYKLRHGELFSRADDAAKRLVAVAGYAVAAKLETTPDALVGQTMYINGLAFNVIGVLEEKGSSGFRNVDEQVWIPLSTGRYRIFGSDGLDTISARIRPGVSVERATVEIERIMRREHQLPPGKNNDFSIGDPRQFFNVREAAADIFAILLASIASISLIVGGIGIMNIMLVTVTERTREIGIRKALGATRFNILLQFVIEAVVMCMLGGLVGIGLGTGIAVLLSKLLGWQTTVSAAAILMAFGFSAGVGLFFGIWPARKASRLDPIEALRYE